MLTSPERSDRRARRGRSIRFESLESRALLATTAQTFNAPSLSALIQEARSGQDTAPAAITQMETALQSQLTSGPLADLKSGAVDGNGFVAEAQSLEASYEQNLDQQLSPEFPHVDAILKLQGQKVVADLIALNQQATASLISSSTLTSDAATAIDSLTAGPIHALDTTLNGYTSATQSLETNLNTLAQDLSSTASTTITPAQASATAIAETLAYQAQMHAGLQVLHPGVSSQVDQAVNALLSAESGLAQDTATPAQSALTSAIATFDASLLGSGGVFATGGTVARAIDRGAFVPNESSTVSRSSLSSVSGTTTQGGTASLTATLTSSGKGQAIAGATVSFTLDGAFAGIATTDSNGVATLSGVLTKDATGTDTGGIVVTYAGGYAYAASRATGDLVVS